MSYLDKLNKEQREAVETTEGPVLIIAGAGSGKTRVLTCRIAFLLQLNVSPNEILALTFTNKAAQEMQERIANEVGEDIAKYLVMGTFHSVFSKILRKEGERLGYSPNFSIHDTSSSRTLLGRILKDMDLDIKTFPPQAIHSIISRAKNDLISAEQFPYDDTVDSYNIGSLRNIVTEVYQKYDQAMKRDNVMDFDDLLLNTYRLFRDHKDVLQHYQERFRYIMVDEFQDTNDVQNRILNLLAAAHHNLCVVGDDAQSIYAFRGAKIQNILNFTRTYPNAKEIKLVTNYRSTGAIVEMANRLIKKNKEQIQKECRTAQGHGADPRWMLPSNDAEEALLVARDIYKRHISDGVNYKDVAVLYRNSNQSRLVEEHLRNYNIPHRVYGGVSFYKRKEVLDLTSYFSFVVNPSDTEALLRIINFPTRGIGERAQQHLLEEAAACKLTPWEYIESLPNPNKKTKLMKAAMNAVLAFREMIRPFIETVSIAPAETIAREIYRNSGLQNFYEGASASVDGEARVLNLDELFRGISDYVNRQQQINPELSVTLGQYMEVAALLTEAEKQENVGADSVTLTTVHSSKGLEFNHVYVVGLEEDLFPSKRSIEESENGLEEERRLCYVAVTRAARSLTVSACKSRFFHGSHYYPRPSRFIRELFGEQEFKKIIAQQRRDYSAGGDAEESMGERPTVWVKPSAGTPRSSTARTTVRPTTWASPDAEQRDTALQLPPVPSTADANETVETVTDAEVRYDFAPGDRVCHSLFGSGKILSVSGRDATQRLRVVFDTGKVCFISQRIAKMKKIS